MTSEQVFRKYSEAGVDIDRGNAFVERIKPLVAATHKRGVLSDLGGFSGLFSLSGEHVNNPVLVSSTDGVGTKLAVAKLMNRHDTIGIDLVAMCVNDVVVCGAKPLFFLDYFASSALELDQATEVLRGIAEGCRQAGCSLIGGETAEMPGLYRPGDYDLAGFAVGICDRDMIIDGSDIRVGNKIIGLASSGLHSNGYSLARKIFFETEGRKVDDYVAELGRTVGEELLTPTRIYVETLVNTLRRHRINGLVHITGGGFLDNIPRVLPTGCVAQIEPGSWPVPPVFGYLQDKGQVSPLEMYRTFNMGIGMIAIVGAREVEDLMQQFEAFGEKAYLIGEIRAASPGKAVYMSGLC